MAYRPLEVTVTSAEGLKNAKRSRVASLSGDERNKKEQCTPINKAGGTSPRWDHALAAPFIVDVAAARTGCLTLKLQIKAEWTVGSDKDVGWVDVPIRELLKLGGNGEPKATSYDVMLPFAMASGKTGGVLKFSYKFGESPVAAPPAIMVYAPQLPVHGAATHPPPAGYPPQVYGYPLQANEYAAPPPTYQQPPTAGGGLLGRVKIGSVMSDALSNTFGDVFDM